jgi:glycosyltransferase involved in cell wall biosynthesis
MRRISLGVVSQTPLIRLLSGSHKEIVRLNELRKDEYRYTVGGVAQMVHAQLEELDKENLIKKAIWFSLSPNSPKNIIINKRVKTVNITLEEESSKAYANFKEEVWRNLHNLGTKEFTKHEYLGYLRYNSRLARTILEYPADISLFEFHDFQQLLLGSMIGPSAPSILRWHIPFIPETLNKKIRKFILNGIEGNDAVIVSTKRDLEGLIRAGFKGHAYQLYPNIDDRSWQKATRRSLEEFSGKYGIKPDDFLVLNVARMDGMKSQNDLIKALSLLKEDSRMRLMLVGNGSFSTESKGLNLPKGKLWRRKLEMLTKRLGLTDRVIFTGYMGPELLRAAYTRADLFVLPSRVEGFGLSAVEAWLYDTPIMVSNGAGVSELVMEGLNGYTFRSGDFREMASKMHKLYGNPKLLDEISRNAEGMSRACYTRNTVPILKAIYESTLENFG